MVPHRGGFPATTKRAIIAAIELRHAGATPLH
jgi:hypothetical protein